MKDEDLMRYDMFMKLGMKSGGQSNMVISKALPISLKPSTTTTTTKGVISVTPTTFEQTSDVKSNSN
jgi:hypothetical protein